MNINNHNNQIIKYVRLSCNFNILYSIGVDDQLIINNMKNNNQNIQSINIDGAARAFATGHIDEHLIIIATHKQKIFVYNNNKKDNKEEYELLYTLGINYMPSCAHISYNDSILAIGSTKNEIFLYDISKQHNEIKQKCIISNQFIRGEILDLSFSPDGDFLASADRNRHIWIWNLKQDKIDEPMNKGDSYQFHNAIPSSIEWSFDSKMLVSCAHDNNIYVWLNVREGKSDNIHYDNAFHGAIRRVSFVNQHTLVGSSADCTIRFFHFQHKK
jgi:WD40 repeat protein